MADRMRHFIVHVNCVLTVALPVCRKDSTNHDQLEHCWEQAAQLAINYQRHRMKEVVNTVSERLQDIGRHQAAGELHESIDDSQVRVTRS